MKLTFKNNEIDKALKVMMIFSVDSTKLKEKLAKKGVVIPDETKVKDEIKDKIK